ncbi:unnamed protein product [Cylindrotheca closterium]|uniref:Uncharacterized protein n=1 Tax=Cylindrotheca closterium TaxID=2856 RepID=A0AAD2FI65_9STRA|nr:unnamed protein product [Cylindrotheca closterium]
MNTPKKLEDGNLSEGTDSTDLDVSFQVSMRTDNGLRTKQQQQQQQEATVTIASTAEESKENNNNDEEDEDEVSPASGTFSYEHVTEIFLRERCMSVYTDPKTAKKSCFVEDLQTLFDAGELQETFEEEAAANADASKASSNTSTKTCSFGGVEIREYRIIPGDSPAGFKGPPLTMGWTPVSAMHVSDVEKFESVRIEHRRTELYMSATQRVEILTNQGFGSSEIQKCTKDANLARRQRKESTSTLKHQDALEKIESLRRKTLHVLTFGQHNKAQKEYLKKYVPIHGVAPNHVTAQLA